MCVVFSPRRLIEILQRGNTLKEEDRLKFLPMLSVFCALFSNLLLAVDDEEFYQDSNFRRTSKQIFTKRKSRNLTKRIFIK